MAGKVITDFIRMQLFRKGGAIANDKAVQFSANALEKRLLNLGIDPNSINNQTQLKQLLAYVKQMEDSAFNQQFSGIMKNTNLFKKEGDVVPFKQKRSFAEEIEAMKKSGDIVDEKDMVVSEKITDREMFKNSNLNKPKEEITEDTGEGFIDFVRRTDPKGADKLQKVEDEIKAAIEAGNKRAVENLKKKNKKKKEDDPEFYTGGMVDVEPSLSDIGHGSDALMARTRLVSPNSQATTSTGLNYLLAEDNDNIRVPFSVGGDAGRRAFLKLLASLTGGAAAVKSGIIGLGEGTTKKAITETVKKSAGSGTPPPYFFKLVEKIKTLGDDTLASKDKATAYKYKDYVLEEDFAGNIEIMKKQSLTDNPYPEDVYMSLKVDDVPIKGKKGSAKVEQYEEYTARPDGDGKMKDVDDGVPDEVIMEVEAGSGNVPESFYTGPDKIKKADGGRINFSAGSLARLGITGSSRRFLEKVFGKEKFARMIENDPELHRGMLEVVEMFRKKDTEGLKMYMQKFLPHMDDATVEDFIVGSGGTEGIEGQLIRLGSGRDYAGKVEMMKKADNMRKLDALDIDKMKPNANGGRIGLFLGGPLVKNQLTSGKGLLRQMLNYMSKDSSSGKSGSEMLQMVNPKQFKKLLNDPSMYNKISPEAGITAPELIKNMIKKIKDDRAGMVEELLSSARTIKKVDDDMIGYKNKIIEEMIDKGVDREMAGAMADMISKKIMKEVGPKRVTPKITEQGLLELENIQKNLLTKDRKLQAQGGLTTMLGE